MLILGLGAVLFVIQMTLVFRGLGSTAAVLTAHRSLDQQPGPGGRMVSAARPDRHRRRHPADVRAIHGPTPQDQIIRMYAPAITATGSGLFMALINILPTWVILVGRDLILALAGAPVRNVARGSAHDRNAPAQRHAVLHPARGCADAVVLALPAHAVRRAKHRVQGRRDLERSRRAGGATARSKRLSQDEKSRLKRPSGRTRQAPARKIQVLKERLTVRVLEIDGTTGKLYVSDPDRVEIRNQADAAALISTPTARRPERNVLPLPLSAIAIAAIRRGPSRNCTTGGSRTSPSATMCRARPKGAGHERHGSRSDFRFRRGQRGHPLSRRGWGAVLGGLGTGRIGTWRCAPPQQNR